MDELYSAMSFLMRATPALNTPSDRILTRWNPDGGLIFPGQIAIPAGLARQQVAFWEEWIRSFTWAVLRVKAGRKKNRTAFL